MLVKTYSASVFGIESTLITIEVNVYTGYQFYIVGLPDNAVKESQIRVISSLKNIGYRHPGKKIVVNLAPADIKKEGTAFDLPIAISILTSSEQIYIDNISDYLLLGELSLDGTLRPIKGVLPIAIMAREKGFKGIILPQENAYEAAVVNNLEVYGMSSLQEVISFLLKREKFTPTIINTRELFYNQINTFPYDFADVKGQKNVKRALEISASGGHNIIMIGPPGGGKTMLAKRLPSILPPLNLHEALETTKIHSVAGKVESKTSLITQRPFRSPHHTISDVALIGGGTFPQPGEVSMAHNGVLFLDELPEFKRGVLEVLRQPIEDRHITISRAKFSVEFPASCMLVASMNPCPCGYYNHPTKECVCNNNAVRNYLNKISGPLLDRIDIHIEVVPVEFTELSSTKKSEDSKTIRDRVVKAREKQNERFKGKKSIFSNAQMTTKEIHEFCKVDNQGMLLLKTAMEKINLSARAYDRILKVSRTIADLDDCEIIKPEHVAEAIQYRSLDRESWGS